MRVWPWHPFGLVAMRGTLCGQRAAPCPLCVGLQPVSSSPLFRAMLLAVLFLVIFDAAPCRGQHLPPLLPFAPGGNVLWVWRPARPGRPPFCPATLHLPGEELARVELLA